MDDPPENDFSKIEHQRNRGLFREVIAFAFARRKYWLIPLVLILLVLGSLIIFSGSSAAPFIYTLF